MTNETRCGVSLLILLWLLGCATSPSDSDFAKTLAAPGVYTLVNLHPDEVRRKLYAVNYQQGGLIPLCSEVQITSWSPKRMTFRVLKTGREYYYDYHKAAVVPFEDHLSRYFGRSCDASRVENLSEIDRKGIRTGRVLKGMSKQGAILAIGYPPPHQTPTLDLPEWRYWTSRFDTFIVVFDENDTVVEIVD